jgi:hypothetical protein
MLLTRAGFALLLHVGEAAKPCLEQPGATYTIVIIERGSATCGTCTSHAEWQTDALSLAASSAGTESLRSRVSLHIKADSRTKIGCASLSG